MTIRKSELIKVIAIISGILGGVVGIGDRLYAQKTEVAIIKTKQETIARQVEYMYNAFLAAAKFAKPGGQN